MRQLVKVFAMFTIHRQQGNIDRDRTGRDAPKPSARSCSTCSYWMRGIKPHEPDVCNAFHSPTQNVCAMNECPDWELKWR
ncbi:hypothetical protein ACQ4M3_25495 [Leptolyngbya sp. AN03gr2]|uniref:hypothetical protein n=1 Tax=unclassified Leptolyngbya TaxID=2650499 RepID=UPI003D311BCE